MYFTGNPIEEESVDLKILKIRSDSCMELLKEVLIPHASKIIVEGCSISHQRIRWSIKFKLFKIRFAAKLHIG